MTVGAYFCFRSKFDQDVHIGIYFCMSGVTEYTELEHE